MEEIKNLINKCIEDELSKQDIDDINFYFQKDEANFIKIFDKSFNNYQYDTVVNVLKNISLLSCDCHYIIKCKCFISIFHYYFNHYNKKDFFKIITERQDLHNAIYFYMSSYSAKDIVLFLQQLSTHSSFSFQEEMIQCLNKIELVKKNDLLNLMTDNEKYYYHLESIKKYYLYSSLFETIDNYFIQLDKSYYKYLLSTICDDSDFCHSFLNLNYLQLKS